MVIAKTASRNIAFKADMMSQAVLEAQTSFITPEATGQDASSERHSRDDDDVERNADFSSGGTKKLISLASTLLLPAPVLE